MTDQYTDLERLAAAATDRPWSTGEGRALSNGIWAEAVTTRDIEDSPDHLVAWCHSDWRDDADAAYIVAACNALPALIARVRELEAALDITGPWLDAECWYEAFEKVTGFEATTPEGRADLFGQFRDDYLLAWGRRLLLAPKEEA